MPPRRLAAFLRPHVTAPIPWRPCDGCLVKGSIVQHSLLNETRLKLRGRIALGCPVQTMSLKWLSLSQNCPGGKWGFNEQRKQSSPSYPENFLHYVFWAAFNLAIHLLALWKEMHPNFLAPCCTPLPQPFNFFSMEHVDCYGSQHWSNEEPLPSLFTKDNPKVLLITMAIILILQLWPPKGQPIESLELFSESKERVPPLPSIEKMGTGEKERMRNVLSQKSLFDKGKLSVLDLSPLYMVL